MTLGIPSVLTAAEVAEHLRTGVEEVVRELEAGRLRGFRVGSEWRVTATAVLEFVGEPLPTFLSSEQRRDEAMDQALSGIVLQKLEWQQSGAFDYEWPSYKAEPDAVEHFPAAYRAQAVVNGRPIGLLVGFTRRPSAGLSNRGRAVVFIENGSRMPAVEFSGANDFDETGLMASILKAPGSRRHLRPEEAVPAEYANQVRLGTFSDVVRGPYAAHSMAVIATKDELDVMAHHALVRAVWKGWL